MTEGTHKGEWHEYSENPLCDPVHKSLWGFRYPLTIADIGDVLWVRETWQYAYDIDDNTDHCIEGSGRYLYRADNDMPFSHWVDPTTGEHKERMPWRPSIHMPRKAARLFLRVTDVRVERLQEITEKQAKLEGVISTAVKVIVDGYPDYTGLMVYDQFGELWNSTIPKKDLDRYGWDANPWVWVIEFERCEMPEDWRRDKNG